MSGGPHGGVPHKVKHGFTCPFSSFFLFETFYHCPGLSRKARLLSVELSFGVAALSSRPQSWARSMGVEEARKGITSALGCSLCFFFLCLISVFISRPHDPTLASQGSLPAPTIVSDEERTWDPRRTLPWERVSLSPPSPPPPPSFFHPDPYLLTKLPVYYKRIKLRRAIGKRCLGQCMGRGHRASVPSLSVPISPSLPLFTHLEAPFSLSLSFFFPTVVSKLELLGKTCNKKPKTC